MIIERDTSHEALHIAGATRVEALGRNRFYVTPPISEDDLPAAEEEAERRQQMRKTIPTLEERVMSLEDRVAALENRVQILEDQNDENSV